MAESGGAFMHTKLPPIENNKFLPIPHFPTRMHAAVFRLWETVEKSTIAKALELPLSTIEKAATDMGLPKQGNLEQWKNRGYITTLRNAWHLLSYEQILTLLEWDEDKLATKLVEEDSIDIKLGSFKPYCEPIREENLSPEQEEQLKNIKQIMKTDCAGLFTGTRPFSFLDDTPTFQANNITETDGIRMIYSYCGLYSTLDNDIEDSFPDSLMKQYQAQGVNAIWLEARLYRLTPFPYDEIMSQGWELRQERLRKLIDLAGKYHIKVFLYMNEPHDLPIEFFEKYPSIKGKTTGNRACLCTNAPGVLDYIEKATKALCSAVPGLGGIFLITQSEAHTHCKARSGGTPCSRCQSYSIPTIISDLIHAIYRGARAADPELKIIAWAWGWDSYMSQDECFELIDRLPDDIILQSNSEAKMPTNIGGVESYVQDYSISNPGPSDWAKALWNHAKSRGMEVCAKVQINNTWECSTATYLPVFDLIREHMIRLKSAGVKHLMLSWTLGGYPSISLKIASQCLMDSAIEKYRSLLQQEFGEYALQVEKAASIFSEAFREFPFSITTAYHGPQNAGPSNLLYENPTGFTATMTCYPYDDLSFWSNIYPEEIFKNQFKKLSERWMDGLKELENMPDCELKQMAWTSYCLFRSSYLQSEFILKRESGDTKTILNILTEEREIARTLYHLMRANSTIGYEAANHYYFNKAMLAEKVICCNYLMERLK